MFTLKKKNRENISILIYSYPMLVILICNLYQIMSIHVRFTYYRHLEKVSLRHDVVFTEFEMGTHIFLMSIELFSYPNLHGRMFCLM